MKLRKDKTCICTRLTGQGRPADVWIETAQFVWENAWTAARKTMYSLMYNWHIITFVSLLQNLIPLLPLCCYIWSQSHHLRFCLTLVLFLSLFCILHSYVSLKCNRLGHPFSKLAPNLCSREMWCRSET